AASDRVGGAVADLDPRARYHAGALRRIRAATCLPRSGEVIAIAGLDRRVHGTPVVDPATADARVRAQRCRFIRGFLRPLTIFVCLLLLLIEASDRLGALSQ